MQDNAVKTDKISARRPGFHRNVIAVLFAFALGTATSGFLAYLTVIGVMTAFASETAINAVLMDSPHLVLVAAVLYLPYPVISVSAALITGEILYVRFGNKGSILIVAAGCLAGFAFSKVDFLFYQDSMIGVTASFVAVVAYWLFAWLPSIQATPSTRKN